MRGSANPVDRALRLAGFVLAHAAWSVSDLPAGGHLIPMAMLERAGKRRLVRYHAETPEESVVRGKAATGQAYKSSDLWAFAWESSRRQNGAAAHALNVDFWASGMRAPGTLVQQFEPFAARGKFRLFGDLTVVIDGKTLVGSHASPALARVADGIQDHPTVSRLWQTWK